MPNIKVVYEYGLGPKVDFVLLPKSDTRTPEQVAEKLIRDFNKNIKDSDRERKVVSAEVYNFDNAHEWKVSTETQISAPHDIMLCSICKAKGIRFGFSKNVTPDVGWTHICDKPKKFILKFS